MKNILMLAFLAICFLGCESSILEDPSTIIMYTIPQRSNVKVTVENSYNTHIATLVDQPLAEGNYKVNFEMNDLPEGIYFYTIEMKGIDNNFYLKQTKRMILVK